MTMAMTMTVRIRNPDFHTQRRDSEEDADEVMRADQPRTLQENQALVRSARCVIVCFYVYVCLILPIPILDPEPRSGTVFVWSQQDEDPDFVALSPSFKDAQVDSSTRVCAPLAKTQVDQRLN